MIPRPVLRYHGAKFRIRDFVISYFPSHRSYIEPYGGGASILLSKPRAHHEVYNDLDDDIVNLFRVLRAPDQASQLIQLLNLTPYARYEFNLAYSGDAGCPVEQARRTIVRSF